MKKAKQSKTKSYLKGKKLIGEIHHDFILLDLQLEAKQEIYDTILVESIPENLDSIFWENLLHFCRVCLRQGGKLYVALPRYGKILLQHEIMKENELITLYTIKK